MYERPVLCGPQYQQHCCRAQTWSSAVTLSTDGVLLTLCGQEEILKMKLSVFQTPAHRMNTGQSFKRKKKKPSYTGFFCLF